MYLSKTILPVLLEAMKQVDQQRPVEPVAYLAIYLLKNQHKIQLPQKEIPPKQWDTNQIHFTFQILNYYI